MPNWTAISADDLKAAGHGSIMDRAQTLAVGSVNPITETIAKIVARVRRKVRQGNRLDTDPTKIPASLKDSAVLLIIGELSRRIGYVPEELKDAIKDARDEINAIGERKEHVEPADDPDADAGPVNPGTWNSENKLIMRTHPAPAPGVQHQPEGGYANPDAPEDGD